MLDESAVTLDSRQLSALAPQRALFASAPLLVRARGAFGGLRALAGVLAAGPASPKPYSCQPAKTSGFRWIGLRGTDSHCWWARVRELPDARRGPASEGYRQTSSLRARSDTIDRERRTHRGDRSPPRATRLASADDPEVGGQSAAGPGRRHCATAPAACSARCAAVCLSRVR